MIHLEVITVSRHKTSIQDTTIVKWNGEQCSKERKPGAEWEEVELRIKPEEKHSIEIANIGGDSYIATNAGTIKIIINNPILFGHLKVGDTIPLVTKREPIN